MNKEVKVGLLFIFFAIGFLGMLYLSKIEEMKKENNYGFKEITSNTAICDYEWICILKNSTWHKPYYSAGVNLTLAEKFPSEKNEEILNKLKNTSEVVFLFDNKGSAREVVISAHASYYLAYISKNLWNKELKIKGAVTLPANFTGVIIKILNPSTKYSNKIELENNTVSIYAKSYKDLELGIGKLILIFSGYKND